MKMLNLWAVVAVLALLFTSCRKDGNSVDLPYENGVFITHEGPFSGGTGTVSFYDRKVGGIKNDIFATENSGAAIGNILQSMTVIGDNAYLVVNNANKVVIADANTFKYKDTLGGTTLPRYMLEVDGKTAYLSEWGAGGLAGAVKVVDLNTKKITKTIPTGKGAERLIKVNNDIWVTNNGGFGTDSSVVIINTGSQTITKTINVGIAPNSLVQDVNGDVWVLCGGSFGAPAGTLVQIKNNAVANRISVPQGSNSLVINKAKNTLYFVGGKAVYRKDLTTAAPSVLIDKPAPNAAFGSLYGLGLDPKTENLYIADAKNFASAGTVYVFKTSNAFVDSLKTGIIPSNFWFQ